MTLSSMCMVVSMACMSGYDYVVMIGIQVYDRHPSVWLSRKLDMETSSFPHLCILQLHFAISSPKTIDLY